MTAVGEEEKSFHLFSKFPAEIRIRIWQLAFTPHIIRWVRTDDEATPSSNRFPYSHRQNIIHHANREAREAIFLHAKFVKLGLAEGHRYSPSYDYLHLDPAWKKLSKPQLPVDPFSSLSFDHHLIRRIMVNPNYTEERMKPGLAFEKLPELREVLVVADEKSVGMKKKFMLASVYDLQKYFEGAKRRDPSIRIPYIAVGCLGWVGNDRMRIWHSMEDRRQLVAVFENSNEIQEHLSKVRGEETQFLERTFSQKTGFKLKFKPGFSMESSLGYQSGHGSEDNDTAMCEKKGSSQIAATHSDDGHIDSATSSSSDDDDMPSLDELPTYHETAASNT